MANSVLPVPGGPYIRMFLYRLLFFLVFLVAMAMSRTLASRLGCREKCLETPLGVGARTLCYSLLPVGLGLARDWFGLAERRLGLADSVYFRSQRPSTADLRVQFHCLSRAP